MKPITFLSINEICSFANATPLSRNFTAGEKLTNAGHILFVGKTSQDQDTTSLIAYCLKTSHLRDKPHEINIVIEKNGKIASAKCTCKAGLSEKCKHIVGVLIYCNRNDISRIDIASCTDKKCNWGRLYGESSEKYVAKPLDDHECFEIQNTETDKKLVCDITEDQEKSVIKLLCTDPDSALHKHTCGRKEPEPTALNSVVPDPTTNSLQTIKIITQNQSLLLKILFEIPFQPLRECCQSNVEKLNTDSFTICKETEISYQTWQNERQFRITGSRAYEIFTYSNNNNPNWMQKAHKYFYPKKFFSKFTSHGLKYEDHARKKYEEETNQKVVQCGLVVPQSNCWLGYSPDGLVFDDQKLKKLIEIKCPYEGKQLNIHETLDKLKYLSRDNLNNLILKKKHKYYAQVQFGMAVLGLNVTDFILYSSFDNSLIIIPIRFDESYAMTLLISLKGAYFNNMIHYKCISEK